MKKLIIIMVSILIVIGGVYSYLSYKNNNSQSLSSSDKERIDNILTQAKAEERSNPPSGYLIPSTIPQDYNIKSNTRFTSYSTYYPYQKEVNTQFGKAFNYLNFSETTEDTLDQYVKLQTESTVQISRIVKEFTYSGNKGVVIGVFGNENEFKQFPLNTEKWLAYDHNGRLLVIHSTDKNFLSDDLINLLKSMKVNP